MKTIDQYPSWIIEAKILNEVLVNQIQCLFWGAVDGPFLDLLVNHGAEYFYVMHLSVYGSRFWIKYTYTRKKRMPNLCLQSISLVKDKD